MTNSNESPGSPSPSSAPVQSLPPGAMSPADRVVFQEIHTPPLLSSTQRLLSDTDTQYASYRDDKAILPEDGAKGMGPSHKSWMPFPLHASFWVPFTITLVLGAVGLEVALHFSKTRNGWDVPGNFQDQGDVMHYVYTLPPVAVAAVIAALWAWTDIEIKKMQPYVDLVHGDSPPKKSLLLDYTRTNNFIVWSTAALNRHYLVALASLMVLLCLTLQPLAAALLVVRSAWMPIHSQTLSTLQQVGLNQDLQFNDLTAFLTAAGYSSASVLYNLPNPPFVLGEYTVAEFQLPTNLANGTVVSANTTAVKSDPGCKSVSVDMAQNADGSGWTNTVNDTASGCSISFAVDKSAENLFGTNTVVCTNDEPDQFKPIIFWFFTYQPTAKASATLCFPSFTLWDVTAQVDLASGNITQVTELQPFTSSSNFSTFSANVTGAPLNGRAYNGIEFNLTDPDPFVIARKNATQLQMPAAVFQSAVLSPQGLIGSFDADSFGGLSNNVYSTYLSLIAKSVYFLDARAPLELTIQTNQLRLFLSDVAVHLLAIALMMLALFGTIVQLFHRHDRRSLHFLHRPGTIASAVSIGAQTGMGELLAGRLDDNDISQALKNRRFRIDPNTMKIIMEGEEGYQWAKTPTEKDRFDRRRSVFAAMQRSGSGLGRQFSWRTPKSPRAGDGEVSS